MKKVSYPQIRKHCKSIGIDNEYIAGYIYRNQNLKPMEKSTKMDDLIVQFCDLTKKQLVSRIISNINEGKVEKLDKKPLDVKCYNQAKQLIQNYFNVDNELYNYILALVMTDRKLKVKDVTYYCSKKFNISERSVRKRLFEAFNENSKTKDYTLGRFMCVCKQRILTKGVI